jgi:hypothetical protein
MQLFFWLAIMSQRAESLCAFDGCDPLAARLLYSFQTGAVESLQAMLGRQA